MATKATVCLQCANALPPRRRKFCSDDCRWRFNWINKPNTGKGWGSKNSQIRLDKAGRRYARNRRLGRTSMRF